jgi:hypothetical protein
MGKWFSFIEAFLSGYLWLPHAPKQGALAQDTIAMELSVPRRPKKGHAHPSLVPASTWAHSHAC